MEVDHKKGKGGEWKSVPAFGEWGTMQDVPDYSMDFTKIREMKKQSKQDFSRVSVGNGEELTAKHHLPQREADFAKSHRAGRDDHVVGTSPNHSARKKVWSYFPCCVR